MHTVFLALGSNVGDRQKQIEGALQLLQEKIKMMASSSMYETTPVGYLNQPNFYNMVVKGTTTLSVRDVLLFTQEVERNIGKNKQFTDGPRTIDVDILLYEDFVLEKKDLVVPHPRMHKRGFVLVSLAEIAPNVVHPVLHKTIAELLKAWESQNNGSTKEEIKKV